jgi:hypothetical protein
MGMALRKKTTQVPWNATGLLGSNFRISGFQLLCLCQLNRSIYGLGSFTVSFGRRRSSKSS